MASGGSSFSPGRGSAVVRGGSGLAAGSDGAGRLGGASRRGASRGGVGALGSGSGSGTRGATGACGREGSDGAGGALGAPTAATIGTRFTTCTFSGRQPLHITKAVIPPSTATWAIAETVIAVRGRRGRRSAGPGRLRPGSGSGPME